ncbi:CHAT domain-containing protein [Scytonema sp. NUACC26]|uniref:CHAT domain-containing protein n=1 Tax=Scytonema sp. NUACC26 TaxID=3140176 RepID=UPI0034DBE03C
MARQLRRLRATLSNVLLLRKKFARNLFAFAISRVRLAPRAMLQSSRFANAFCLTLGTIALPGSLYQKVGATIPEKPALANPVTPNVVDSNQKNLSNARDLLQQGRKLYEAGNFSEAVTVLQQAADASKLQNDGLGQAIALSNLSLALKQLGQLENSSKAVAQSLELVKVNQKTSNSKERLTVLAQILDIQGSVQLEQGKAEQALDSWKEAANTYNRVGDEVGRTRCLINQSVAQQSLGLYRQSKTTLEQVNKILQKEPDSPVKAMALRRLGDVFQLVGDLEPSRKILQQSRDVAQKLQSSPEIAAALLSLGNIERALGNQARGFYGVTSLVQQQTVIEEKSTPLRCVIRPLSNEETQNLKQNRGNADTLKRRQRRASRQRRAEEAFVEATATASSHYQQAARYYQEATTMSASPTAQIQAEINRFSVLLELQQWSQAESLLPTIQSKLTNIPLSQTAINAQINLAQNLMCLKQATPSNSPSWKEIAQLVATSIQRAKSLGDKRLEAYALGVLGGLYVESQDRAVKTLDTKSLQYAQTLTEQALTQAQTVSAVDMIYLWQWQLGNILRMKGDIEGAIASYTESVNTLKSLRNDLIALNPNVQFSFRDNVEPVYRQLVDLLLQKGQNQKGVSQKNLKQAREIIEALQLSELENFFREACLLPQTKQIDEVVDKTDTRAAVIYPIILKDRLEVILKLPMKNGLLHYTTQKSSLEIEKSLEKLQQYLPEPDRMNDVKKLSQEVYSWLIQPLEAELETRKIKTLVFVLDGALRNIPMAALYDEKQNKYLIEKYAITLAPGLQLIDPKPLQKTQLSALAGGLSEQRTINGQEFPPLENVKLELAKIQAIVPKTKKLLNQVFTKPNLQSGVDSAAYIVVHLATHGEFSSNADKTFILTWETLLKVKDFDNLLQRRNQRESKAIELLVLSACETAAGDRRATLGLAGIAVRAGARSTLATLWSVDDQSTAELMSQFYQELENATTTKAEALRRAQIVLLKKYNIPYFWAPYVLLGNWL